MSSEVNVEIDTKSTGFLVGVAAVVGGLLYFNGFKMSGLMGMLLAVSCVLVALLLWLLLTDKDKLVSFIKDRHLLALAASCAIAANVVMSAMQNMGMRSLV
jgi:hypothetical protein